jgi:hypothetical protein
MYAKDDGYLDNLFSLNAKDTPEGFAGLDIKAYTVRGWKDFGTYEKWEKLSSEFTDVNGRIVKNVKFDGVSETQISVSELSSGIYMMKIVSDKGTTTKKVIKE